MESSITFSPLIPWMMIYGLAALSTACILFCLWRGLSGWALRGLAALVLLGALIEPSLQEEAREDLSNIVLVIVDKSESQTVAARPFQIEDAVTELVADIEGLENFEIKQMDVKNDANGEEDGTFLITALNRTINEVASNRIAGAVLVTDGQIHDVDIAGQFNFPVHVLLTGEKNDWDRRLIIKNAPAFAILDEVITLTLRIEEQGNVPTDIRGKARVEIAIDDADPVAFDLETNTDLEMPLRLPHGGINVLQFNLVPIEGELTERNNSAVVSINGVRDRLRVLLVSGEPYAGERTWRNLLKSDSAVDLVHFTILRPPEKQDNVPVRELSLIAFPTRELFLEKVDEFDLIIFDRYSKRGLLPPSYLRSVVQYVRRGGAVLVASGPSFASVNSMYRTPLSEILPAEPTARVYEEGYRPTVSDVGTRHPVTENLESFSPITSEDQDAPWGRWFRHIDAEPLSGTTVMTGVDGRPLLVLDRVDEGRIALLLSDHAWLWSRGFEGGGPQLELLRRLGHWMMKEPDLEEERLTATAVGQKVTITRRSVAVENKPVTIESPDGTVFELDLKEVSPGRWQGNFQGSQNGLYRLSDGLLSSVFALGPSAPKEFENTIASGDILSPIVSKTKGAVLAIHDVYVPNIRLVRTGRVAGGRDWIGLTPRNAYVITDITSRPLLPAWLLLFLTAILIVGAWRLESR
ncbi:hypothetical protein F9L33_10960 [Amylibacter sp. SFDW26]|uniref:hypothetical protein n=1 Tax=Amylibacter sp. SFDW26 TaxID=2652722 RepID=UPI0012622CDE|nr:hypothetical protein [Amylibacter sp. SFDW26]KAB7613875.1 hypothetical protein F9L33_10960 [Amylibacter sp. SFDW26]